MNLKQQFFILLLSLVLTSCGLKKPLAEPDQVYPNEPDCTCDNPDDE